MLAEPHRSLPLLGARPRKAPPPPQSVRLSLTDRCDLACVYCRPHRHDGYLEDRLEDAPWETMVRGLVEAGVRRVRLTGGEPLLHPRVVERVRFLASLGVSDLAMTTNATQLSRYARPLSEAGLSRLTISIDSLDEERFAALTRGGSLPVVLDGIEAARAAGFSELKLNAVILRHQNDGELAALARFAWERGIVPRFIEVMKIGEGAHLPDDVLVTVAEMRERLRDLIEDDRAEVDPDRGPARYVRARHDAKLRIGFISGTSDTFCEACDRLRVSADGVLRPCLATNDGVPAAAIARAGDVAGIREALAEAWEMKPDGTTWKGCTEDTASDVSMRAIGGLSGSSALGSGAMRRALVLAVLASSLFSCTADKPSSIVVALTSEAPIPTGIDAVRIQVMAGGSVKLDQTYPVGPNSSQRLPGTLVINREDTTDKTTPVTITVTGMLQNTELTHRRATLAFSDGKQKLLRMPVQFSCFDVPCEVGETCKAGACVSDAADVENLPDFDDAQVFPVKGSCFDRDTCIEKTEHETSTADFQAKVKADPTFFDTKNCTLPTDPAATDPNVNMGFTWTANPDQTWTAVDFDAEEGWQFADAAHTRIKLAPGLCKEMQKPDPRIRSVVTATGCKPKVATQPECAKTGATD